MIGTNATRWRRIFRVALLVIVVLIGYFILRVVLFVTGKPAISVNYAAEYNERVRPADFDPNDNAAPDYREAFALLPTMPEDVSRISRLRQYEPSSIEWKIVESWITSCDEAIDLLHRAAAKPCFWGEVPSNDPQSPLVTRDKDFVKFREASFCLRHMAEYQALQGDMPGAFRCVVTLCRMARHLADSGRIYANLGQIHDMFAHIYAFELLSQMDVDSSLLADVQTQLEDILSRRKPPSFGGDEIVLRDIIQRCFTHNRKGDGRLAPGGIYNQPRQTRKPRNELEANTDYLKHLYVTWTCPTRRQTIQTLEALMQAASQCVEQSPWQLHLNGTSHEDQLRIAAMGNVFLRSRASTDSILARTIVGHHETRLSAEALIATIGILRFHKDKGAWPRSLEELAAAGYLRRVPIDPYSGKPLVYRQADDAFILYGCGRDFDDDHGTQSIWGKPPGGGDQVFWPVEEHRK